jgi:hypothetical protein
MLCGAWDCERSGALDEVQKPCAVFLGHDTAMHGSPYACDSHAPQTIQGPYGFKAGRQARIGGNVALTRDAGTLQGVLRLTRYPWCPLSNR